MIESQLMIVKGIEVLQRKYKPSNQTKFGGLKGRPWAEKKENNNKGEEGFPKNVSDYFSVKE